MPEPAAEDEVKGPDGRFSGWPVIAAAPDGFGQALAEFGAGDYFAAHESLEALWLQAAGPEKNLLQGLIQLSVACHHWQNGNLRGAASLLAKARPKLACLPAWLDPALAEDLSLAAAALAAETAANPGSRPSIRLRLAP